MFKKLRITLLTMLAALMLLGVGVLTACGQDETKVPPQAVAANTIKYDGTSFTWSKPNGYVRTYTVTVNNSPNTVYALAQSTSTLSFPYASFPADTYNVTITANNDAGSSEPVAKTFYHLQEISAEDLSFTPDGTMSWLGVPSAAGYKVEINGEESSTIAMTQYPGTSFKAGLQNRIRVKAVGPDDTFFSLYPTSAVTKTYLGKPTGITYQDGDIEWTATGSGNATRYAVRINGNEVTRDLTKNRYQYDSRNLDFKVHVQSLGDGVNSFDSPLSDEQSFVFLGEVKDILINEDGILQWSKVEKALSYELMIEDDNSNKSTHSTTGTTFDELVENIGLDISIRPKAPYSDDVVYFTTWSPVQHVALLKAPKLKWNNALDHSMGDMMRALYWDEPGQTGNISEYNIKIEKTIDGHTTTASSTTPKGMPSFEYDYREAGTYIVKVQAVATVGGDWSNSRYSEPFEIRRLPAPEKDGTNFLQSNAKDISQGVTINYRSVNSADSYALWYNGAQVQDSLDDFMKVTQLIDNTTTETLVVEFKIQSRGVSDVTQGLIKLPSVIADSLACTVEVLPVPTGIEMSGGTMSWNIIDDAKGYFVGGDKNKECTINQYDLTALSSGSYGLKVCSMGDGKGLLPSAFSEVVSVKKLSAPTNIRVDTETNEGQIIWKDEPSKTASSYDVYLNGETNPKTSNEWGNINKYAQTGAVTVQVVSVANKWVDGVYVVSSDKSTTKQFAKLDQITFPDPAFRNGNFEWNAPLNINTDVQAVKYRIKVNGVDYTQMGNTYSLATLPAGDYTFIVTCLGDGEFVASDPSKTVSVTKLDTPQAAVDQTTLTRYVWPTVPEATGYQVRIDGELKATIKSTEHIDGNYYYTPSFSQARANGYKVEIIAIGDNYDTVNSDTQVIMQVTKKLNVPTFTAKYVNPNYNPDTAGDSFFDTNCYVANGQIVVSVTGVANAWGYSYTVGGTTTEVQITSSNDGLTYYYTVPTRQAYPVSVKAMGGMFDTGDIFYIESDSVGGDPANTITVLSTPNLNNIRFTSGNVIRWDFTQTATFRIKVVFTDGSEFTDEATSAKFTVDSSHKGKTIARIEIQMVGNGITTISSDVITTYAITSTII